MNVRSEKDSSTASGSTDPRSVASAMFSNISICRHPRQPLSWMYM
jgi:hypothetical protein